MAPALQSSDLLVWPCPSISPFAISLPERLTPGCVGQDEVMRLIQEKSFCLQSSAHTVWCAFLYSLLWVCIKYEIYITWLTHVGTILFPLVSLVWLQVLMASPDVLWQMRSRGPEMEATWLIH